MQKEQAILGERPAATEKQTFRLGRRGEVEVNGTPITMVSDFNLHCNAAKDTTTVILEFEVDEVDCAWGHCGNAPT